jgi:hypothetical protein
LEGQFDAFAAARQFGPVVVENNQQLFVVNAQRERPVWSSQEPEMGEQLAAVIRGQFCFGHTALPLSWGHGKNDWSNKEADQSVET